MKIRILFDSFAINNRYKTGWGFSALIDEKVLFDTGEKGEYLLNNIKEAKVNLDKLETIVISHNHWDHIGGVELLATIKSNLNIYVCSDFEKQFKDNLKSLELTVIENSNFNEILTNVYLSHQIYGNYKDQLIVEQSLAIKTENGISILVGCAHPSIVNIVQLFKRQFPDEKINFLCGGFHLKDSSNSEIEQVIDELEKLDIKLIAPTHCCGDKSVRHFKEKFGSRCLDVKVGMCFEI